MPVSSSSHSPYRHANLTKQASLQGLAMAAALSCICSGHFFDQSATNSGCLISFSFLSGERLRPSTALFVGAIGTSTVLFQHRTALIAPLRLSG